MTGLPRILLAVRTDKSMEANTKKIPCYTVDFILTNAAIQGLVFFGSYFVLMPNIICSLRNNHQENHFESAPSPFLIQWQAQQTLSLLEATMNHDTSDFLEQNVLAKHVCLAIHVVA